MAKSDWLIQNRQRWINKNSGRILEIRDTLWQFSGSMGHLVTINGEALRSFPKYFQAFEYAEQFRGKNKK